MRTRYVYNDESYEDIEGLVKAGIVKKELVIDRIEELRDMIGNDMLVVLRHSAKANHGYRIAAVKALRRLLSDHGYECRLLTCVRLIDQQTFDL